MKKKIIKIKDKILTKHAAKRRVRSDAEMALHKATPSMTAITLTKLKNSDSKPINKDARLIVSKNKKF